MKKSDLEKFNKLNELAKEWDERSESFSRKDDQISTTMHWAYMDRANELREALNEVFSK